MADRFFCHGCYCYPKSCPNFTQPLIAAKRKFAGPIATMNTEGCPEGFATDQSFENLSSTAFCSTSLNVYWGIFGFVYVVDLLILLQSYRGWRITQASRQGKRQSTRGPRAQKPVAVIITALGHSIMVMSAILIGFNKINVFNGFSWLAIGFAFVPFALLMIMVQRRLVRLGSKIIPFDVDDPSLAKFNLVGQISNGILATSFIVFFCTFSIVGPILPDQYLLVGQLGLLMLAIVITASLWVVVYQYQRCIETIRHIQAQAPLMAGTSETNEKQRRSERAVRIMRQRQVMLFSRSSPGRWDISSQDVAYYHGMYITFRSTIISLA